MPRRSCDDSSVAVLPGAEPYYADGGPVGVVLCHGFTGSPQALRPWAAYLAERGLTVSLPRLPGHGTSWRELSVTRWPDWYAEVDRAFGDLRRRCDDVFVFGLSMGGTLALRLAEEHGPTVRGVVVVNPSLLTQRKVLRLLPLVRFALPTAPGITNDIKRPGVEEVGYHRIPLQALHSLTRLWRLTCAELSRIEVPVLLFRSPEDHVVEPASGARLLATISSGDVEERLCGESYHVATLDHDAPAIFDGSFEFVRRLSPLAAVASRR
jgi:carboxylesterase